MYINTDESIQNYKRKRITQSLAYHNFVLTSLVAYITNRYIYFTFHPINRIISHFISICSWSSFALKPFKLLFYFTDIMELQKKYWNKIEGACCIVVASITDFIKLVSGYIIGMDKDFDQYQSGKLKFNFTTLYRIFSLI